MDLKQALGFKEYFMGLFLSSVTLFNLDGFSPMSIHMNCGETKHGL
jgi:hypothetical protein